MLFTTPPIDEAEQRVVNEIDELWKSLRYQLGQPRRWYGPLRRLVAAKNVQASNSIEGYNVSVEDAAALLAGEEPADASTLDAAVVRNYGDAMTYILQLADDPTFEYSDGLRLLKTGHVVEITVLTKAIFNVATARPDRRGGQYHNTALTDHAH